MMGVLRVLLFGKLSVLWGEQVLKRLDGRRVQELLGYLLLYRDRPHPRETLAGQLWGDCGAAQSKKYLRQALWQLQAALSSQPGSINCGLLVADPEWLRVNPEAELWLDVAVFEQAFASARGMLGQELDSKTAENLQVAVHLYRGDLLEGWYQDWCLYERERLQNMYLAMLDKLMGYCEAHGECETGLAYGECILRYDLARERAHWRLMRLQYLAGDRTAAIRQYERCVAALNEELGVRPSRRTVALYEQIVADRIDGITMATTAANPATEAAAAPLREALGHLNTLQGVLTKIQAQIQQEIQTIETVSVS